MNTLIKRFGLIVFVFLLFIPNQIKAKPDILELHRIWTKYLDQDLTTLKLADLDQDGTNEILLGFWDGDSGHIEVFRGSDGLLIKTGEKIHTRGIIDMDVGDIDGDQDLEVVLVGESPIYWTYWYGSQVCVLDVQQLSLQWQGVIEYQLVECVEATDLDKDDTAEVFVGSYFWTEDSAFSGNKRSYEKYYEGTLYNLDGSIKKLITEDKSAGWRSFLTDDIDNDSYNEIVCGTGFAKWLEFWLGPKYHWRNVYLWVIDDDGSRYRLSTLFSSYESFYDDFNPPHVKSMAIGNCDSDENKEIVSYVHTGREYLYNHLFDFYYPGPPEYILTVTDASTGTVEQSKSSVQGITALTLFDIDAQPPDEILIAHSNGVIEAINGITFDTVAISDPLPPISFFAFGDVSGDAMLEICISDGDSLFLYSFNPTDVGEENQENLASEFTLNQNYPNPFNAQTTIKYYLLQSSNVELAIYNIKGQKVKTLVNGFQSVGFQSVTWDGTNRNGAKVASGIYFYRIRTDYSQETRKMVLIK
ncbi:MAG: FlgD immunoglobulin-like domain containing protein [Candidatus Zixiibacteriota bacterium]